jgi:putative ABC transport system permease protein
MKFTELFLESVISLTVNKIRTGLAMLGVVIGIGSVIALMSLGAASEKSITTQIQSLGTNLLTIRPGFSQTGGIRTTSSLETLTNEDAKALTSDKSLTAIDQVAPMIQKNAQLIYGRNNTNKQVYGVTSEYQSVNNVDIEFGTFIQTSQQNAIARVAVLGSNVASELFNDSQSALGKMIRISNQAFTVIGVTKSTGGSGMLSKDDLVFVPLSSAQSILFGQTNLSSISVSAIDADSMDMAESQIQTLLLSRHKIKDATKADFQIMSQEDLLGTATSVTGTFTTLLSGIAAISLVVGGIGIMNIMLVTVTERTREIGLRKALGAKNKIIITQFLVETVLITVIGGLIGVITGVSVSYFLSQSMSLPFVLSLSSVALAFSVSVAIGLIFGLYPAKKAADLQPIEALRYE